MSINDGTTKHDDNASGSTQYLSAKLYGKTSVQIVRDRQDISWDHQIHAINWFNTRFLFLYNFYNFLAARSVTRVSGVPLFKGRLIARVLGDASDQRDVLLIVQYPSPRHFRDMLGNSYFKFVSIVRAVAVQRFTFCLTHTLNKPDIASLKERNNHFGVHHFRGNAADAEQLLAELLKADVPVLFSSLKTHELATANETGTSTPVPTLMDGIVVFACEDESVLQTLVATAGYQNCINSFSSSFVALFKQIS